MKANVSIGDIVRVVFLDHAEGTDHIKFEVFGRVYAKDRKTINVVCWGYEAQDQVDDNVHSYTIIRSAIVSMEKLRAVK